MNALEIENLSVSFNTPEGEVETVRDVSIELKKGEILALVGESGCGKTVLCKSVMKLLPQTAKIKQGQILIGDTDVVPMTEKQMCELRGKRVAMVFQDPMTSLNPCITIGKQILEAVKIHNKGISKADAKARVLELMSLVGIEDVEKRYNLYPYNFSGGMRQRSVLAIAMAANPDILLADEPTTALDVTTQAQILSLLRDLKDNLKISIVFVTHDLGVVARVADRVAVMYAGKIIEVGTADDVFYDPRHPYTWGLLRALPSVAKKDDYLKPITGMPPSLVNPPKGDAFAVRNPFAMEIDYLEMPPMFRISDTHSAATWLLDERAPLVTREVYDGA